MTVPHIEQCAPCESPDFPYSGITPLSMTILCSQVSGATVCAGFDELEGLTVELDDLLDELEDLTVELEELVDELEGLTVELEELVDELEGLTVELEKMVDELEGLTVELDDLLDELEGFTVELEEMVDELEVSTDELENDEESEIELSSFDELDISEELEISDEISGADGLTELTEKLSGELYVLVLELLSTADDSTGEFEMFSLQPVRNTTAAANKAITLFLFICFYLSTPWKCLCCRYNFIK